METNPIHGLMNPASVAVVGASNNFTTMGTIQCLNLLTCGFPGEVLPVHPKEETVLGKKAYPSISALPYAPDMAVLVVPTRLVPEMLEDLGRLGTRSVIIVTAGFRETGEEGRALEKVILETARKYGMRFLGPNCLGIINTHLPLNITVGPLLDYKGKLSLASQSGTYIAQVVSYLHRNGIALSKAISVGNEVNIDLADCIEYLGRDEDTKAIGLYIEGIRDAARFMEVAGRVSTIKPIVAQYVGGSKAGARSGSSHTGAMAGPSHIYEAMFRQAGIISVDTIEDVYKTGWALATQPPLKGRRIAVLTNSGGPGTGMANTLDQCGLEVPEFSPGLQEKICSHLPAQGSGRNPVDLTFHIDMKGISEEIPKLLFESDETDGIIIHGIMDTGFADLLYPALSKYIELSREQLLSLSEIDLSRLFKMPGAYGKPLLISSFFDKADHCIRSFHENHVPTFDSPEKAARAMGALYQYQLFRQRSGSPVMPRDEIPQEAREVFREAGDQDLDEFQAKRLLRAYGIPTAKEAPASTLEEVKEKARIIGYPVVLKVCSAQIRHKTELGMVYLNLQGEEALMEAYHDLRTKDPSSPVLIAGMIRGDREFTAGMSRHPGFPPCIMFGLGGILTEALNDFSLRIAPFSRQDALDMMMEMKSSKLLGQYRGMETVDRDAIADILVSLSHLSLHFPQIREIDLNPIIMVKGSPIVADALIL